MIRPFEHGGNIYRHAGGRPVLDFSANINPLGLAEGVRNAISSHLDDVIHYPDPDCTALREALSRFYHLPVETIVPGNGAAELLYLYFHHFHFRRVNTNGLPGLPGQRLYMLIWKQIKRFSLI